MSLVVCTSAIDCLEPPLVTERVVFTALKSTAFVHVVIVLESWHSGDEGWMIIVDAVHNLFHVVPFVMSNS